MASSSRDDAELIDSADEDEAEADALASATTRSSIGSPIAAGSRPEELALERARRRYDLEDPSTPGWALHKKHIFVLSSAGKPVFSRYGDESQLAPQMGLLQALISFVHDRGDAIRYIKAGGANIVFVLRGALYLVAVCRTGEPVEHVWRQLGFLHSQIISILTAQVDKIFQKNASYDVRGLLGGTDRVLRSIIHTASSEPTMMLRAVPCLRMPPKTRDALTSLVASVRPPDLLFGVLLSHSHLVSLLRPKRTPMHADDLLLVMNTVASSTTFREDESWLPICLPKFNRGGFLYAHVSIVLPELYLVLLTPKADGFPAASECRQLVMSKVEADAELKAGLVEAIQRPQYSVADLGVPHVCHCLYRLPAAAGGGIDMYTAPRTGRLAGLQSPYHDLRSLKRLLRHYMLAHSRVHGQSAKPLRQYVQTTGDETIVVWTAADFELYVAFSPLVSKHFADAACHRLQRKLKRDQASLFMMHRAIL